MRTKSKNNQRKIQAKHEAIEPHVSGSVLHIGCIGPGPQDGTEWFHEWLDSVADDLVGIDIDEDGVERARDRGYDCRVADAERFDLNDEFDTIVAANVIEHLNCPGRMIESATHHLAEDGSLVITTPRTFTPQNLLRELHGGMEPNDDHVAWYCRKTLGNLLARYDLEEVYYEAWGFDRVGVTTLDKTWRALERVLARLPPLGKIDKYQHLLVASPTGAS